VRDGIAQQDVLRGWTGIAEPDLLRRRRGGRIHPSRLHQADGLRRRGHEPPADRHLQHLERAERLQQGLERRRGGGEARYLAGGRLPAGVPDDLARGDVPQPDLDALPQPRGDGHRGDDPRAAARWRRAADQLRQDDPRRPDGRGERRSPHDPRQRWPGPQRPLQRADPRSLLGLSPPHHRVPDRDIGRADLPRDRGRHRPLDRALHGDGHRLHHELPRRSPGHRPPRQRRDPGTRRAPPAPRRGGGAADRDAGDGGGPSLADHDARGVSRTRSRCCTRSAAAPTPSSTSRRSPDASGSICRSNSSTRSAAARR